MGGSLFERSESFGQRAVPVNFLEVSGSFGPRAVPDSVSSFFLKVVPSGEAQEAKPKTPSPLPDLPCGRVYDTSGWRKCGFAAHLFVLLSQTALLIMHLHSSTWWPILAAQAPVRAVTSSAWVVLLVCALRPRCPIAAFWALAFATTTPVSVLMGLGTADFAWLWLWAASLLWLAAFAPTAQNARLGLVGAVLCSTLQLGLLGFTANVAAVRSVAPPPLRSMIMPVALMVYEGVATALLSLGWQRFYRRDVPLQLFNAVAIVVVQSAEAVRLVDFLTASLQEDRSGALRKLAVGIGLSVCADVIYRSLIVDKLLMRLVCTDHEVTPEYDAFLRARFEYGYTPFAYVVCAAVVLALHGVAWAAQPMFWVSLAAGLAQEMLTDATFVVLHWLAARRVETPAQTLRRLLAPGGHQVLCMSSVSRMVDFCVEDAAEGDAGDSRGVDATTVEAGGIPIPLGAVIQVTIAAAASVTTMTALQGNFGTCADWMSEQLCLGGQ